MCQCSLGTATQSLSHLGTQPGCWVWVWDRLTGSTGLLPSACTIPCSRQCSHSCCSCKSFHWQETSLGMFYPDSSTANLPNPTWLAGGRMETDSWFWRDKIIFWLPYWPFCFAFAAWCCASCRFPGRWPVSSWPSAVVAHHPVSGTQWFCHWQKQFATFFPQPRVHPCQSQQAVFLKFRKNPCLKQLLKQAFLNLVYSSFSAVSATVLCSWGQSWGDSSCWKPTAPAAWVILAQNFSVWRQSFHQLPRTCSGALGMSLMVQKPVSLRYWSQLFQRNLILVQEQKNVEILASACER